MPAESLQVPLRREFSLRTSAPWPRGSSVANLCPRRSNLLTTNHEQPVRAKAADAARVGLRVKAPVIRIHVLRGAGSAHREAGHRRSRSIVRDVLNDGVARPAMGAIGERITVAPVMRVAEIAPAGIAGPCIGRNQRESSKLLMRSEKRRVGKECRSR